MSLTSAFLWRFLEDVWDILPTADRLLFEAYWTGQIKIAANLEQKVIEAALSTEISRVPVFLTERWNRFAMTEESCDLVQQVDAVTLNGSIPSPLSRETGFYDTLRVSKTSGQIFHEETLRFFDGNARQLRYGKIVKGTLALTIATKEFTLNRDYVVNLQTGMIQALDEGRIPTTELVTLRYQHTEYVRGLDYDVDEVVGAVRRLADTTIEDGAVVSVSYTYNATAVLPLPGTTGGVRDSTLTDLNVDFSSVIPGRTLTITSGPNEGTYVVNGVPSPIQITVTTLFPQAQDGEVVYAINAFPHGMKVDKRIVGLPTLRNLVDDPTIVMVENVDYVVRDGLLAMKTAFPLSALGPAGTQERQMWAETTSLNKETPYRNFGVLINFFRANSEAYKLALQGLWYTFWTGSTPGNLQRGLHILLGLPFAKRAGLVTRVDAVTGQVDITDPKGQVITYGIPTGLAAAVVKGQVLARFDSLSTGVQIIDRNNSPGFVARQLGLAGIDRFLTSTASRGGGDTDATKALKLLEHHLFLPQVLVEALNHRVNVQELVTFLDNMKPSWTEYVFSFASEAATETLHFTEDLPTPSVTLDVSTTIGNNEQNRSFSSSQFYVSSHTGEIDGSGSQVLGNFEDNHQDFTALGIDANDILFFPSGPFAGYHLVLARISDTRLAIDIPDADLLTVLNFDYSVVTQEQAALDHDAINLRNEHTVREGLNFLVPSGLNTATDADLTGMSVNQLKGMLLLDIANVGLEVQAITDADLAAGELEVGTPPATGLHTHQIASCALIRTNNVGTVTHVFPI